MAWLLLSEGPSIANQSLYLINRHPVPAFGVRSCNHTVLVTAHSRTSMGLRDPRFEWAQAGVNTSFTRFTLIFRVCFSA